MISGSISGATRLAAVIGRPVRHSLSPALHNAAFRAGGLDWAFVALDVGAGGGAAAIAGSRALGIEGLSVTMPLKEEVAVAVDRLAPAAAALGAVNAVVRDGDELVGHNTDGQGFVDSMRARGWEAAGQRCVVIGAGGAARAVVLALAGSGAAEVVVVNRTQARAEVAAALASCGRVGTLRDVRDADLVVNATPVGMATPIGGAGVAATAGDSGSLDVAGHLRGDGQRVVDLLYVPLRTNLLDRAEALGAVTANGVGMLVHQAALAFALWTGAAAPVEVMTEAVRAAMPRL